MPQSITLQDGSVKEVLTDEEVKALQEKANKVDELSPQLDTLKTELEGYKGDKALENFRVLREKLNKANEALKLHGKQMNDDGTIVELTPKPVDPEELIKKATEAGQTAATSALLNQHRSALLAKYNPEERKIVEHYYNKLITGETVTIDNMEKFINEAASLANPNHNVRPGQLPMGGQAPRIQPNNSGFTTSDLGKSIADEVFGTESFTKAK